MVSSTPFQTFFLDETNTELDASGIDFLSTFEIRVQVVDIANQDNVVNGAQLEDIMNLMGGDDLAFGNDGNDSISGGDGDDELYGGAGDDEISGGDGNDFISGGDGEDLLFGGSGNDTVSGDAGDDRIYGNSGDDMLYGMSGADLISGGIGDDTLSGGEGDDALYGEDGNDDVIGNAGNDTLTGGNGADRFIFIKGQDLAFDYVDVITDFNVEEDVLVFEGYGFKGSVFEENEGFFLELLEAAGDVQQIDNDLIINGSPGEGVSNPIDLLDFGTSSASSIVLENVRYDQIGDFDIEFVDPIESAT